MLNQRSIRQLRASCGFTLVELLISMALLGILMTYITSTLTTQYQTYSVIDQVSETQNNMLAVSALIERDIRNAGYMIPKAAAACGIDSTSAPDTLMLSDAGAILPVNQLRLGLRGSTLRSQVTNVAVSGAVVVVTVDDVVLDENPTYDIDSDGTDDSDYQVGAAAIMVDGANSDRGMACGVISAIDIGARTITLDAVSTGLSTTITRPEQLWLVPAVVYSVSTPTGASQPEIQRNGRTLARDVEDLQVAYFFDDDDDGTVDTLEYRASALNVLTTSGSVAISPIPSTTVAMDAVDGTLLREIRINIVARTRAEDPRNPAGAGAGQARENRTSAIPGADGRRRRVRSATVRLRNLM